MIIKRGGIFAKRTMKTIQHNSILHFPLSKALGRLGTKLVMRLGITSAKAFPYMLLFLSLFCHSACAGQDINSSVPVEEKDDCLHKPKGADSSAADKDKEDSCGEDSGEEDSDGDGVHDDMDAFAHDICASIDTDNDGMPDTLLADCTSSLQEDQDDDDDGVNDTIDVDDDNDGLIEIATALALHNVRHDLAGHSYDDEADDSEGKEGDTRGAPTKATVNCDTATSGGVYLCGYELTADIDFGEENSHKAIDLNQDKAGNMEPIGSDSEGSRFRARLEGNGHSIANLRISRTQESISEASDAALFRACQAASFANLILVNPRMKGLRKVAVLCGVMRKGIAYNVHIHGGIIQGDEDAMAPILMGALAGEILDESHVEHCSSSADVLTGGRGRNHMGGLAAHVYNSKIANSRSSGKVYHGGQNWDYMGGLVGVAKDAEIIGSQSSSDVSDGGSGPNGNMMAGLVAVAYKSKIIGSQSSGNVSHGEGLANTMGGLVGSASHTEIIGSHSSGNVSYGADSDDMMGGLVGYASNSKIIDSQSSGHVFYGSYGNDNMGGLVGRAYHAQIISSQSSGNVSRGGVGIDHMGGLVGVAYNVQIIGSQSSGDVSGGGDDQDYMGGLVGDTDKSHILGSQNSGDVSDGGDFGNVMGGLVGEAATTYISGSRNSGDIFDGGQGPDKMGGVVGYAINSQIIGAQNDGDIFDGGGPENEMGGLAGLAEHTPIINSHNRGKVSHDEIDEKTSAYSDVSICRRIAACKARAQGRFVL